MKNLSTSHTSSKLFTQSNNEIDLSEILRSLLHHKSLIAKFTIASIIISTLYAITRKPIWEGQFEIVLATNQSSSSQAVQLLKAIQAWQTSLALVEARIDSRQRSKSWEVPLS